MQELPSGTVTLLVTDIEGSTRLLHALGQQYADVLAEHRRVLRAAFSRHRGVEVDTQGDSFFVAFARAQDAVAAAGEAQDALAAGPVRVRIGIHTGEPVVTAGGYVGIEVHRAARIMGAAHGVRCSSRSRRYPCSTPQRPCAASASTGSRTSAGRAPVSARRRRLPAAPDPPPDEPADPADAPHRAGTATRSSS